MVGMRSMPGNPHDGHTLADALQQLETLTGYPPGLAVVDRGYRGHWVQGTQVLVSVACAAASRPACAGAAPSSPRSAT